MISNIKPGLLICAVIICASFFSCVKQAEDLKSVATVNVSLVIPEGSGAALDLTEIEIKLSNKTAPFSYIESPDSEGKVSFNVQPGKYDILISGEYPKKKISVNASVSEFLLTEKGIVTDDGSIVSADIDIVLNVIKTGSPLIIKELYYHGCSTFEGANYTKDRYLTLYNNSGEGGEDVYLDSLCIATIFPHNSTSGSNPWKGRDTIPIAQMFWMIPGNGHSYCLHPGEETTIAMIAAVDHSPRATSALQLNRVQFGCYSETLPGHEIAAGVTPLVCYMCGQGTAWAASIHSPAIVIFKTPMAVDDYYADISTWKTYEPGKSSGTEYYHIPKDWILDGVECADKPEGAIKRLPSTIDASYVYIRAAHYSGTCVTRKLDDSASEWSAIKVYKDTNNSDTDFDHDAPLNPVYCR
ncbi:MAG: DUF4876 domain-containing protein [Alistipes sp.]|nr:DUF4876 domain-containing protein [Candidatus Minthomonas equi]